MPEVSPLPPLPIERPVAPLSAYGLDPDGVHLNHGAFGACPRAVLAAQDAIRARLEAAPMRFFVLEWQALVDEARARLAAFVGADPAGLVFVPNTTTAVSTVLASLELAPGDELLATDHTYRACRNALDRLAARTGARVVVASIPFPVRDPDIVPDRIASAVTARTRLALIDHITSPTGIVNDLGAIAAALAARGVPVLVDGAHVPGQLPLELDALVARGVTYYVGNCHKWLCAPKGAAFLWIDAAVRDRVRPLTTSHGASLPLDGRTRFQLEHDWTGTHDPSSYLAVPAAIDTVAALGGSWPAVMERNHRLAVAGRDLLGEILGARPAAPADLLGALATVPITLPGGVTPSGLERQLLETGWEVPIVDWPQLGLVAVRIAAQLYNHLGEVEALGRHLHALGVRGT